MTTCLYFHITNNQIFYVGIGDKDRPFVKGKYRSKFWNNIVNKHGYDIDILKKDMSWEEACELEKYWISKIGRRDLKLGPLVNQTDGGEGAKNCHILKTTEHKKKIGLSNKISQLGNKNASGGKGRISAFKGKKHSEESIKKCSDSHIGIKWKPNRKKRVYKPWSEKRRLKHNLKIKNG